MRRFGRSPRRSLRRDRQLRPSKQRGPGSLDEDSGAVDTTPGVPRAAAVRQAVAAAPRAVGKTSSGRARERRHQRHRPPQRHHLQQRHVQRHHLQQRHAPPQRTPAAARPAAPPPAAARPAAPPPAAARPAAPPPAADATQRPATAGRHRSDVDADLTRYLANGTIGKCRAATSSRAPPPARTRISSGKGYIKGTTRPWSPPDRVLAGTVGRCRRRPGSNAQAKTTWSLGRGRRDEQLIVSSKEVRSTTPG